MITGSRRKISKKKKNNPKNRICVVPYRVYDVRVFFFFIVIIVSETSQRALEVKFRGFDARASGTKIRHDIVYAI